MFEIDESEIESKFYDLCRLCASFDNVKISVFSDEGKRRQLKNKIQCCLPFKVEEDDGLPKSLCYKCVYNLESTYEFRYKCIEVNKNLEKHLSKKDKDKSIKNSSRSQQSRSHPENDLSNQNSNENNTVSFDSEDATPNPMDFLEVGVNSEENTNVRQKSNSQDGKKSYSWKADKRWLSVEHKPLNSDSATEKKINMKYFDLATLDENSSRRKNCNPRKIARESEVDDGSSSSSSAAVNSQTKASKSSKTDHPSVVGVEENEDRADVHNTMSNENSNKEDQNTSVSDQKLFTCLLCERNFTLRAALNKHFSTIHGIEPYEVMSQTPLLSQSFMKQITEVKNEEELESMVEQETIIFCEVCRREFQDRASLWLHMVHAHREEAAVSCGICLKICCDNITLIEHVNTAHSGDKAVVQRRYSCQVCGRQHDSRQKLLKHATLHTLIDNQGQTIQPEEMVSLNNAFAPRECPICHKKFFNEEKLNHHTQNFHNDTNDTTLSPSTVYKCELCTSAHATRMDRWWHMYHSHNGDNRVTCDRKGCRKVFVSPSLKDEHAKSHHETQGTFTNTCEICGKLWESRTVFYKHMMNVHPKCLPTICGICMKIFSNVPELRVHVQNDHPPLEESGGICCDVCGRPYTERSKMLRHRRVHNVTDGVPTATSIVKKKDDLVCSFCPDVNFDKYEDIAHHRRTMHQLFVCDLCPKFYNGNNHLWKHVSKQHKGDPSVTCNLCLRTSASRAHLERHKLKYHSDPVEKLLNKPSPSVSNVSSVNSIASITDSMFALSEAVGETLHKCNLCGKVFRIRSLLKKHSKSCKGVRPVVPKIMPVNGMFPCSKCSKVFKLQNVLSKHMRNSHITHYCEVCEEPRVGFDTKTELLRHIREQHSNHHELACDVPGCGKILRLKVDLKKHKLEHLKGYFTYICEICGDMFSNRKKLRKHLQTYHKNDVKYLCAVCNAIHQTIDDLVAHVHSTHLFVLTRPCTCQICGKCWTVSSKVVEHIGKVHGKEYKPCKICWRIFTDEKEFEEHTENHPPIEEKPAPLPPPSSSSSSCSSSTTTVSRKSETRIRPPPNKHGLAHELMALGVSFELDGSLKRSAEDEDYEEGDGNSNKRLRRKYKCIWCKETFRSIDELKDHKAAHHSGNVTSGSRNISYVDEEPVTLDKLPVEVKHESNKVERWTDVRPIACDCCEKIWNSKKQLWQHLIRSHPYESQHTCGICLQVCRDYMDLFYHLDDQHSSIVNDNTNRFSCFVCGHYHNSQSKLDKHFAMHKNPPPPPDYTCQYCHKVFKSIAFYRDHMRTHEVKSEVKSKPTEFSGFSINHILANTDSRNSDAVVTSAVENDVEEIPYNIKFENEEANEEDLVELEEDDTETDNDSSASAKELSCDDNTFREYEAMEELPQTSCSNVTDSTYFNDGEYSIVHEIKSENVDDENFVAQSSQEYSPAEETNMEVENDIKFVATQSTPHLSEQTHGIVNGNKDDDCQSYGVNNNQKQLLKYENENHNFHNSNGENYYEKMTDDV